MTLSILLALLIAGLVVLGSSVRVVTQFERGVVLRFGRLSGGVRAATSAHGGVGVAANTPEPQESLLGAVTASAATSGR
jgi:regulator of protease activity HflC (stomatin/prohibitin superfamily)